MFTVYILFSEKYNQIYIGYTADLIQRFHSHNTFANKGHTIKYRPWKVIYLEYFDNKHDALIREKQLKGGQGRQWIKQVAIPKMINIGFISA